MAEADKVKIHLREGNRTSAKQCLKRKRLYQSQIYQLEDQMFNLRGAQGQSETPSEPQPFDEDDLIEEIRQE